LLGIFGHPIYRDLSSPFSGDDFRDFPARLIIGNLWEILFPFWVPKSKANLTRLLWYTLGTAHDFKVNGPAIPGFHGNDLAGRL
jgi:hypothetical protein